ALDDAALEARYAPRTRSVAAQFAHMHSVRTYHLEAFGKRPIGSLASFPRGAEPARKEIRAALAASAEALAGALAEAAAKGKVPSWKGTPASWLAYFCAHEAHHRGLALAALRVAGVKVPKEVVYGLWEGWGKAGGP
ncbi:MAG: DinB family protein, partial [Planctomycetaceae bacterium]|nr:DinB family protein [Planctomycetaceae bacterium]